MQRRRWMALSATVLAVGVLAAGCSSGSQERFNTVGARIDGDGASSEASGSSAGDGATEATIVPAGAPIEGRQVTYRATLVVRVADATDAAAEAQSIADDAGGYLARSDASLDDDRQVALTLRLPSAAFDGALDDLAALGDVRERSIDSDDVTDEVVDLRGRLENAQASAQRIRELLAKAEQVQNLIALEDRLTQRQTEIEALEGQLAQLDDRVELATIDLTVTERQEAEISDDVPGPAKALRAGGVAVVNIGQVLLAVGAFLVPFAPFLLAGAWLARRTARRRRARAAERRAAEEARRAELPPPPRPTPAAAPASPLGGGEPEP